MNEALQALEHRSDVSMVQAYVEIAARLPDKTVRDVAARVCALRSFDPAASDLAVSHMGAATAAAGLPVPGANPVDGAGLTGTAGEALPMQNSAEVVAAAAAVAAQNGGSWNDPSAMFTGPSSIRSTMRAQSETSGSETAGIRGDAATSVRGIAHCFQALPPCHAVDGNLENSHIFGVNDTMQTGGGHSTSNFPFELQVSQLLQENIIIISSMRTNLLSVKVADNLPLMENFYKNMQSIFSMLSALPCAMPPLPSQYRINDAFIRHLSTAAADDAAASSSSASSQVSNFSEGASSSAAPTGAGPSASEPCTNDQSGTFTHGQQAGMAFPNHPSSIRANEVGASILVGSERAGGVAPSEDDATALQISMAPPTVQTGNLAGGQQSNVFFGVGGVLGASPANALQALPLGQPAPPPDKAFH